MQQLIQFSLAAVLGALALPAGATIVNLTTSHTASGNIGQCIGGAVDCGVFTNVDSQSTGTGVIDPFYTVQNNGTQQGFNSDAPGSTPNYDMKRGSGSGFTKAIQVSAFGLVDINGNVCNLCAIPYIRFLLDINEAGGNNAEFMSIDSLQLYVKATNDIVSTTLAQLQVGATKVYDLDNLNGLGSNTIYTDYRLNSGSGSGDVIFLVPYSIFAGHTNDWLYLYGNYGNAGTIANGQVGCNGNNFLAVGDKDCGYSSSSGFEEWARIDSPGGSSVPEPSTFGFAFIGLLAVMYFGRKRLAA